MKRTLFACFLTFYTLTAFAQAGQTSRVVHTKEKSAVHVPPQEAPAGLKTIYSNLGKSKTDLYDCCFSWGLDGPGSGYSDFIAIPFTPKSDSHVLQVRVAVQYATGDDQVNLSIYRDTGGAPGTLLAGPVTVTNLPDAGSCCTLAIANFSPATAVTGGTQYWVVADTPLSGTGSDFEGGWNMVAKIVPIAFDTDSNGWSTNTANDLPAGEVLGTIP